jgi:phosphatidylinositol alpha-1,6-mannosyltransferase
MKICLLSDTYPPDVGGVAVSARRLASGLVRAGHTVHVCVRDTLLPPGRMQRDDGSDGDPIVHRLGPYKHPRDTLTAWSELAIRLGRQEEIDLYHGFFLAYAGFIAAYTARLLGVPSVVSARGNDLERLIFDAARASFTLEALRLSDAVTAVSRELAARATALVPQANVYHVPNGVDADRFCPAEPKPCWEADPGAALGFVGEARVKKGLAILLNAFAQIAAVRPAHLVLVGGVREKDAPILDLFRRQHPDLSLQVVPYLDHDQLPGVYNALDLLLFPSFRDGLPNALLEAMACARPVIATPVGGIADVVRDGVNGFLVPPSDTDALAQRTLVLLDDQTTCQTVGSAARETILQAYTPHQELQANLAVYRALGVL